MTLKEFQLHLKGLQKEFQDLYDKYAPYIAGQTAVRMFKENFQKEGFFGEGWQEVKRRQDSRNFRTIKRGKNKGEVRAKYTWVRHKILRGKTGDLGKSIHYKVLKNGTALIYTDPNAITSKKPYGRVHNEGLRAGRGSGFTMPKRQFMGDHPKLRTEIVKELERKLREKLQQKQQIT